MQVAPVTRIQPLTRISRDKYKITALPPDVTVGKQKKKTWIELLSPYLIVVGFILFVMLCNGLIGG